MFHHQGNVKLGGHENSLEFCHIDMGISHLIRDTGVHALFFCWQHFITNDSKNMFIVTKQFKLTHTPHTYNIRAICFENGLSPF